MAMDKEARDYLDQKYVGLARKEDLEKLRQETKASFRQLKEESKTQLLEWKQEIITTLEESRKQWGAEFGASFDKIREDAQAILDHSERQMEVILNSIKEEGKKDLLPSLQETRSDLGELKTGLNQIQDQTKQLVTEVGTLNEKVRAGVVEVKEELGAMIKFSFSDLERKLNALEARIQVLEKIVLQ
jgi:X-X-X-Leu-X-X-Gly heptad repeat protein